MPSRTDGTLRALATVNLGGAAVPASLIAGFERHSLTIVQGWGMTETSPLGTLSQLPADLESLPATEQYEYRARQGMPIPLIEIRARDDDGALIAWDDQAMGELEIRGPWVAAAYHGGTGSDKFTEDGWFSTGDVVRINERGCMRICDRAKDLVKSGGEWISSVDLENQLMGHSAVAEAAVIAIPDEKWGERPLAAVVLRDGMDADPDELRSHLANEFAKWQLPDRIEFVEAIPRTATASSRRPPCASASWASPPNAGRSAGPPGSPLPGVSRDSRGARRRTVVHSRITRVARPSTGATGRVADHSRWIGREEAPEPVARRRVRVQRTAWRP